MRSSEITAGGDTPMREVNLVVSSRLHGLDQPVARAWQDGSSAFGRLPMPFCAYFREHRNAPGAARIRKAHQPEIAELFARIILGAAGFFDGESTRPTRRPVGTRGPEFRRLIMPTIP